ncbi:histidine--tRNA ligase [Pseudalkalibacillus caeni]|uniref:Histidine--tRNA ligase n=1 Tax=Exobacillus caeni TaxID=2574798 RepID=A0A5R9EVV4_9BACL|nr:histidine--tRNA ligase [Pseudalkalibacillus caeni]TLS34931.1 histidine--tRNA ligase [Pseudalkalibacillus caeni]
MLRNLKGTTDYLPQEQQTRKRIQKTLEEVFELYGCKPLETPILNYYDLMASKYGGGEEILKEVYRLNDQGERDLSLRYDLTIPFAKVIGMNPEMRLPLKRYEIGKVFRDGPIKAGRFREFIQCDVDVVGIKSVKAEADLIAMALDCFERLGLDVTIQLNNRKLLTGLLNEINVPEASINDVILSLDKLEKIGLDGVLRELSERKVDNNTLSELKEIITNKENCKLSFYEENFGSATLREGIKELKDLFTTLEYLGLEKKVKFTPFLARGLNIYTGTIYEIFLTDGSITSSIGSGGRYDTIIGNFLESERTYPTAGISFGLDVIYTALKQSRKFVLDPAVDVFIIPIGTEKESMRLAGALRRSGIRTEIELSEKRLKKSLDYANKENIPYVLLLGENELEENKITVKNMESGEEQKVTLDDVGAFLKIVISNKSTEQLQK